MAMIYGSEAQTVKEVCKLMKVGERTVRRKIEKNVITAFLEGGKYLIDKKKLDNYLINKSLTHLNTKMK